METEYETMKKYSTDWLASDPVFYNTRTGEISKCIHDLINYNNVQFHPEGLNNYLDFGYSVFQQTPIKNVKFLRHSSQIEKRDDELVLNHNDDPVSDLIDKYSTEEDALSLIKELMYNWESKTSGRVIVPVSGGYDSRLLTSFIEDKSRIRAFTYGLSDVQSRSEEVVYAKKLSEILEFDWQQIHLGDYHTYFQDWDNLYGPATHAHGMYHMEFYKKIKDQIEEAEHLLSGIIGDVWAGLQIPPIDSPDDLETLGYTHRMHSDSKYSNLTDNNKIRRQYWSDSKNKLKNRKWRIIESMRLKIILLSYLYRVPQNYDLTSWSPFLDIDVAMSMVNLSENRRENRQWQEDYFKRSGIYIENMDVTGDRSNTLNHQAITKNAPDPLDKDLLGMVVEPEYVENVNSALDSSTTIYNIKKKLLNTSKVGGALKLIGISDHKLDAYFSYLTLRPIENVLRRSENYG